VTLAASGNQGIAAAMPYPSTVGQSCCFALITQPESADRNPTHFLAVPRRGPRLFPLGALASRRLPHFKEPDVTLAASGNQGIAAAMPYPSTVGQSCCFALITQSEFTLRPIS
jgi:hypothetical protein